MAKNPGERRSKTAREPVTIDLDKDDVKRIEPEGSEETNVAADDGIAAEGPEPSSAQPEAAAGPAAETASVEPQSAGREEAGETPEAGTEAPAEPEPAAPPVAARSEAPRKSGGLGMIGAGFIGSLLTLGAAGGAWYAGYVPARDTGAAAGIESLKSDFAALKAAQEQLAATKTERPGVLVAQVESANARLGELSKSVESLNSDIAVLRAAGAQGGDPEAARALAARLDALETAVQSAATGGGQTGGADAQQALQGELDGLKSGMTETRQLAEKASGDIAALARKTDALEQQVNAVAGKIAESGGQKEVAQAIAAAALKSAIDRGVPFMTELETFASVSGATPAIEALRSLAAAGVPTRSAIAGEAADAAYAMIGAAETVPENAGLLDRLALSAKSLVKVRKTGETDGETVADITARMEADIQHGDYAKALAEYDTLPDPAKAAGADFAARVKARMEADKLVDDALSSALKSAATKAG